MKFLLSLILLAACMITFAQDRTLGTPGHIYRKKANVLVIPPDENMYRSTLDIELARANQTEVPVVRSYFRQEISRHVADRAAAYNTTIFLDPTDRWMKQDLDKVHAVVNYEAVDVPRQDDRNVQSQKRKNESSGTRITKGQVTVAHSRDEKYMRTRLSNEDLIQEIQDEYGTRFFVFLGQIDLIISPSSSQESIQRNAYMQQVRVHYTVSDRDGKLIDSGMAVSEFPSAMKSLGQIRDKCFASLAEQVTAKIPHVAVENIPEQ